MRRRNFRHQPQFSWDAGVLDIRHNFHKSPEFYAFTNIFGGRQYFMILLDSVAANICVYIFSICLCIWVCANIFGAIVLTLGFKIDIVVMIIIINFVLTL